MINKSLTERAEATSLNTTDLLYAVQTTTDAKVKLSTLAAFFETQYFNGSFENNFTGVVQSIQHGAVNSSNEPEFLTESGGVITLAGSSTTFRCNIGDGYSDFGKKCIRLNLTTDLTLDLSSASDDDYYIIADYDDTTSTMTLESNTVARVMSTTAPTSPSTGDLWYDITNNMMKKYNGSSWEQVYKIVLGMVNKASSVYTVYNRAFNDFYESDVFSVSANTAYDKPDNLFTDMKKTNGFIRYNSSYAWESRNFATGTRGFIDGIYNERISRVTTGSYMNPSYGNSNIYGSFPTGESTSGEMKIITKRSF